MSQKGHLLCIVGDFAANYIMKNPHVLLKKKKEECNWKETAKEVIIKLYQAAGKPAPYWIDYFIEEKQMITLSQPKSVIEYNGQTIAWAHDENEPSKHLTINLTPATFNVYGKANIQLDGHYIVSIWKLKDDIIDSVKHQSPDGYIEKLKVDLDLQVKFTNAINQIFDPAITN